MPMREECKHYQSRTYKSGEVARFCVLDMAPEAPWKCPDNCPTYERRMADVGWQRGTLVSPPVEDEPEVTGDVTEMLGQVEEIVNDAAPEILKEVLRDEKRSERKGRWRRKK
jgi:hypothetical protein